MPFKIYGNVLEPSSNLPIRLLI